MLPLVAVVMTLCGVLAYGVAWLGADAVSAARARTAADAAALAAAGAPGDRVSIERVARANGAEVVDVEWVGPADVRVRVRMLDGRGAEAAARARAARGVGVGDAGLGVVRDRPAGGGVGGAGGVVRDRPAGGGVGGAGGVVRDRPAGGGVGGAGVGVVRDGHAGGDGSRHRNRDDGRAGQGAGGFAPPGRG